MFHYLEHSTEPAAELMAARRAVRPGGHLLVEVPAPDSRYARLLGRWWLPWLQPQHLHFMPIENLRRELRNLGFTVVAERHADPHDPVDLLAAGVPALLAGTVLDRFVVGPLARPLGLSNAYRLVARRD